MSVCCVLMMMPLANVLAGLAQLVFWFIYWSKIAEYSRQLDRSPDPIPAPIYL